MRVAFLSLPVPGHLNPMTALARKYQARGHDVVFLSLPDVAPFVQAAQLPFVPCAEDAYPQGSLGKYLQVEPSFRNGSSQLHGKRNDEGIYRVLVPVSSGNTA